MSDIPAEYKYLHTGLMETAEKMREISAHGFVVKCPRCHEKQWSILDKLFTFAFQMCVECCPESDLEMYSDAIFKISRIR